jgi:hypothetical protein
VLHDAFWKCELVRGRRAARGDEGVESPFSFHPHWLTLTLSQGHEHLLLRGLSSSSRPIEDDLSMGILDPLQAMFASGQPIGEAFAGT